MQNKTVPDKHKDTNDNSPDRDYETGLDFIELSSELPGAHQKVTASGIDSTTYDNLPAFPTTEEEWDEFKKDDEPEKSRIDYFEPTAKDEQPKPNFDLGTRAGVRDDIPDKVDDTLPPGKYKPWEIIINRKTGSAYGFSKGEFKKWQREQEESHVGIKCDSCGKTVFDNPFTGFQSCPNCGAKMSVLVDDAQKVIQMQTEAMKFTRKNAPARKGFMTCPLDIPASLLKSLAIPDFKYEFFNHNSMFAPLTALFLFLATLVTVVNLVDSLLFTRISGLIMIVAIIMSYIAISRSIGIFRINLKSDGVTFTKPRSKQTIRYSRIISISLTSELSLDASLRKRNPLLIALMAPFTFVIYVLTLGLVNLYDSFHEPAGESDFDFDFIQCITIKTRGLQTQIKVSPKLMPDLSRVLGILIYMSTIESPKIMINPHAYFAAQRIK